MALPSDPKPWLFYRIGPAKEKTLFKRRRETYDGVIIPGHIASYYSKFCSEFIGSLGKPYFIDPMTYIFAYDPSYIRRFVKDRKTGRTLREFGRKKKGDIKRSYRKLIEVEYGGVMQKIVEKGHRLHRRDFKNDDVANEFVNKVVEFQRRRLSTIPEKYRKYTKYAKKGRENLAGSENPPMCVVAPYFRTTTLGQHGWHATNVKMIQLTKALAGNTPVFAVILAETSLLANHCEQICSEYSKAGADGFLLWPDGFSGSKDFTTLRSVFDAVETVSMGGKPAILMYGDAFSLVLHYAGLAGSACGICYGEKKLSTDDVDVEGLIPPRYYLRILKKKVQIETEARRIKIDKYPDLVCNCEICQRKPDPVTLDDTESREHFMLTRADEIGELRGGLSREEFASALGDAYNKYESNPILHPVEHLRNWGNILAASANV